jgi:hypothetical protein
MKQQHTFIAFSALCAAVLLLLPAPLNGYIHPAPQWPNVENTLQRHPRLLVPEGTTNLARNKPVTAGTKEILVGELAYITDGDKDASEGYEVELASGPQWVQIDLGKTSEIYAIAVWHFFRIPLYTKDVVVQVSDDPTFKKGVVTLFNTDFENIHGLGKGEDKHYRETNLGKVIPANGVKARYVRLYSAGNSWNSSNYYIEVEVYGVPVRATPPVPPPKKVELKIPVPPVEIM